MLPLAATGIGKWQFMKEKTKKVGKAVVVNCIIFALLICISIGALAFTLYYKSSISRYQQYVGTLLNLTINQIDGDDLKECIATKKASEKYEELQHFMDGLKNTSDIEYIYALVPLNTEETDSVMYVIAGISDEERPEGYTGNWLGRMSGTEYSTELASFDLEYFRNNRGITYFSSRTVYGYQYSGMMNVTDSNGEPVCILAIDIAMDDIEQVFLNFVVVLLLGCSVITVLFLMGQLFWMKRRVIDPVKNIELAAKNLKEMADTAETPENLVFQIPETPANDEMRAMAVSLGEMSLNMQSYMRRLQAKTRENQRITSELDMAHQIQEGALPNIFPAFPEREEFEIYASMSPAKEVGGDFYDFFFVDKDHFAMVIADVSGKGVPAALFMMISKALLKSRGQGMDSPKRILEVVNNQLCENNEAEMFVTVWIGILDLSTGKLVAANAGHEYPALCRANGQFELFKDKHGFVLAGMDDARYTEYELQLHPGDSLFLYTDGVAEATNDNNELFGTARMLNALNREPHAEPEMLLQNVRRDIDSFVGAAPQFDDITMLGFKLK